MGGGEIQEREIQEREIQERKIQEREIQEREKGVKQIARVCYTVEEKGVFHRSR